MNEPRFSFRPSFGGQIAVDHLPDDFFERMERRVNDGLFVVGRRTRAHYRVVGSSREALEFEAEDFLTAYAVGLNHVTLTRAGRDAIAYRVSFARWTRYAVLHGAVIGLPLALAYLLPFVRHDVEGYPFGPAAFWSILLFWSVAWPWLLTALHRPFAARTLERILREELGEQPRSRAA